MLPLKDYLDRWARSGRTPTPQQVQGLTVAHQRASRAPWVMAAGGALALASIFSLITPGHPPMACVLLAVDALAVGGVGFSAQTVYQRSLGGSLRGNDLGAHQVIGLFACLVSALVTFGLFVVALVPGGGLAILVLAMLSVPAAVLPWLVR